MKKITILHLLILCASTLISQNFLSDKYSWEESVPKFETDSFFKNEAAVLLFYKVINEMAYTNEKQTEVENQEIVHKIYRINEFSEISKYNKVYIPFEDNMQLAEIKARTISPTGTITEFDREKIKEIKDEDDGQHKIFAIEGAETGGIIEYYYKIKKPLEMYGDYYFQFGLPIIKAEFDIISPQNLIIEAKSYNGFPAGKDTVIDDKRFVHFESRNIPLIKEEKFAYYGLNKMRVEFKLAYNTAKGRSRFYTWQDAAQRIFNNVFVLTAKEVKLLSKELKNVKIGKNDSEDEKITKIDTYIRRRFYINSNLENSSIETTLKNKMTTRNGMLKLYAGFLSAAGINCELVYTTERNSKRFDPDFDSWNFLSKPFFYLPATKKYLAPHSMHYSYGIIPYNYINNYGLFIKKINIGGVETALAETRFIEAPPASHSQHNLYINIEFTDDMAKNKISMKTEKSGYNALLNFMYYPFIDEIEKEKMVQEVVEYFFKEADFESLQLLNKIEYPLPNEPISVNVVAITSEFIENAGDKIILRIGETIGEQSELYAENTRKLPVENYFNRSYLRDITFKIPKGYRITNPDDVNFNVVLEQNGKEAFLFRSSYTIDNDVMKIHVFETYEQIHCPIEKYEDFQKVINAAADFNKVFFILELVD